MSRITLAVFSLLLSGALLADQFQDATNQGIQFGQSQQGHIDSYSAGKDSNASLYGGSGNITASDNPNPCNQVNAQGQQLCGGQNIAGAPTPSQYYSQGPAQLQAAAQAQAATDPNAQYGSQIIMQHPAYGDVTPKDPLFQFKDANSTSMTALSQTYTGCKDIAYGGTVTTQHNDTCSKTGTAVYQVTGCNLRSDVTCSNANAGTVWPFGPADFNVAGPFLPIGNNGNDLYFGQPGAYRHTGCQIFEDFVTFNIESMEDIGAFRIQEMHWDDSFILEVNGTPVEMAYGGAQGVDYRRGKVCEFSTIWTNNRVVDIRPYLHAGQNQIHILNKVGGGGTIYVHFYAERYHRCAFNAANTETCDAPVNKSTSKLVSSVCTDGPRTITIGRDTITLPCVAWREGYQWEDKPTFTEEAKCQDLRNQGCTSNGSTCNQLSPSGWCLQATQSFTCTATSPEHTMSVCADTLVCPGGNCSAAAQPPTVNNTADFAQSASYIAMMQDMKQNFDPKAITVWKGTYATCQTKNVLGLQDKCCNGSSGFLNSIGVASCSYNDKLINTAKQDQRQTLFNNYTVCNQSYFGKCVSKSTVYEYCLWPSKLARIVQVQGKAQIGVPINSGCTGFSLQNPDQFAQIDWSKIDLSEYFSDVMNQYNATSKPSAGPVVQQMQQQQQQMTTQHNNLMNKYYGK